MKKKQKSELRVRVKVRVIERETDRVRVRAEMGCISRASQLAILAAMISAGDLLRYCCLQTGLG